MFKNTDNKRFLDKAVVFLFATVFLYTKSSGQENLLDAIKTNNKSVFDSIFASGHNINKRKTTIATRYSISRKRKGRNGKVYINRSARRGIPFIFIKRTELHLTEAVFNENYYFTEQLLKHGANPDKKKNIVLTPLGWAAHRGNIDIVKLLLDHGANINASEKKERTTALIEAIEQKHFGVAKYLIDKGADINLEDKYGKTALGHAAIHKNEELVKILVVRGADVNHKSKGEQCILEDACSDDKLFAEKATNIAIVKYLVERGASVINDAISIVLRKGEFEVAKYLFSKGAPVSNSLLLSAANGRNFEMFKYLVDSMHLDINYHSSNEGWKENVLHTICRGYWEDSGRWINVPMLQYALEKRVNVNDINTFGESALLLLVANGSDEKQVRAGAELLIKKGANVNISGGQLKFSPLMYAASSKLYETAGLLIQNGSDVNARDHESRPILHWAAWKYGNAEMIKLLVENGADINAKDDRGETAAMSCVVFGRNENIKTTIELGADLTIKDKLGYTLLDHVSDEKIIELLKNRGAKSGKDKK